MSMSELFEKWDGVLFSFYNFFMRLLYLVRYPSIYKIIGKNKELKNKYKGKRCYIVLNGPSINQFDLSFLEKETVFVSNYFFRSSLCEVIKPNFYCWLDSKRLNEPGVVELVQDIKKSCPESILLLNYKGHKYLGEREDAYYVYTKHLANYYGTHVNLSGLCSNFFTVAFFAIASAIYMGFESIYVMGLDFEPVGFTHFTNLGKGSANNMPGEKYTKLDVAGDYWQYAMAQYQSYALNEVAKKKGCKIYNLNKQSYIRSFEFVEDDGICPRKKDYIKE